MSLKPVKIPFIKPGDPPPTRPPIQFVDFGYTRYNPVNPPHGKYLLAIDTRSNSLYVCCDGLTYRLEDYLANKLIVNGKLKPSLLPDTFASKVYVDQEIDKKVRTVFKLKGTKDYKAEIMAMRQAQPGDVWLCRETKSEFLWDGAGWEQLGPECAVDKQFQQRLQAVETTLSGHYENIVECTREINNLVRATSSQQCSLERLHAEFHQAQALNKYYRQNFAGVISAKYEQLDKRVSEIISSGIDPQFQRRVQQSLQDISGAVGRNLLNIDNVSAALLSVSGAYTTQQLRLDQVSGKTEIVQEQLQTLSTGWRGTVEALQTAVSDNTEAVRMLETQMDDAAIFHEKVSLQLDYLDDGLQALCSIYDPQAVSGLADMVEEISAALAGQAGQISDLSGRLDTADSERSDLAGRMALLQEKVSGLNPDAIADDVYGRLSGQVESLTREVISGEVSDMVYENISAHIEQQVEDRNQAISTAIINYDQDSGRSKLINDVDYLNNKLIPKL